MFGVEPKTRAGRLALEIYAEVLDGVRADHLVGQAVQRAGDLLFIHGAPLHLDEFERVFVCGAGKASVAMAEPLVQMLGDRLAGGLIITKEAAAVPQLRSIQGSHPVPDERSLAAGKAMLEFATQTISSDLVLFCLSGGASALMEALPPEISLDDLQATTQLLLKGGADIAALNAVRSRLSLLKGGGLATAFKAKVVVLVLSDVVGHDLSVVGSGPFMPPKDRHRAHAVALKWEESLRPSVKARLLAEPLLNQSQVEHAAVGSAALLWPLAAEAAKKRGLQPVGYADPLKGEARAMAGKIMRLANAKVERGEREFCMVLTGETTVTVKGEGKGGRSQEMAVKASTLLQGEVAFLAAGTDGTDGPTDAAGGLIEPNMPEPKISAKKALATNDSYPFLAQCGGLIKTGPTGSNVNDLVLVIQAE